MTSWDPMKHPHGQHGHWATVGGAKGGRKKVDRSVGEGRGILGRSGVAFQPSIPASTARTRKEKAPEKARAVRSAYDKHASGRATYQEREAISFQSPKLRSAQTAKTGSAVRPREQAIAAVREQTRGARSGYNARRTNVKTTFGGKTTVVRGEYRDLAGGDGRLRLETRVRRTPTAAQQKSARHLMSAKPATPPAHKAYTRGQLGLKTDAALREILTSRGTSIPKGARTKALVDLIVGG